MLGFGSAFFITFQFLVVFLQDKIDFIGLSAIFISANATVVLLLIFFTGNKGGTTMNEVLSTLSSQTVLYADIMDLFTIPKVKESYNASVISGGIQAMYTSPKFQEKKKFIIAVSYFIAEGILAAYSFISYEYCNEYGLGILNSILIQSVDVLIGLYIYAEIVKAAYYSVLLSLLSRFFIFILTGNNWFVGYSCVYWIFSTSLCMHLINSKFPLLDSVAELKTKNVDVAKTSEFIYLILLGFYIILTISISLGQPSGVPLTTVLIQGKELKI